MLISACSTENRCVDLPLTGHFSYNLRLPMRSLRSFNPLSVVSFTSSSVNVLTPGCAPRTERPFSPARPSMPLSHLRPSTLISPKLRSPLTRIFFALAFSDSASASTSNLRLSTSESASRPASRLLCRVARTGVLWTGSRFARGVDSRFTFGLGFGGAGLGMILSAVVLMPLRMALLLAMFSSRLRSNALMVGSFLGGMVATVEIGEYCEGNCRS